MSANVLQFPGYSNPTLDTSSGAPPSNSSHKLRVITATDVEEKVSERIAIDELYPADSEAVAPELKVSLRLLAVGLERVEEAIEADYAGDQIAADDAMQRLQALLPELFCCRNLSDSFGAIIIATYHALKNTEGQPLTQLQIRAIGKALGKARSEPFMRFESSVDEIMALEQAGFVVEPETFEYLADCLDE